MYSALLPTCCELEAGMIYPGIQPQTASFNSQLQQGNSRISWGASGAEKYSWRTVSQFILTQSSTVSVSFVFVSVLRRGREGNTDMCAHMAPLLRNCCVNSGQTQIRLDGQTDRERNCAQEEVSDSGHYSCAAL